MNKYKMFVDTEFKGSNDTMQVYNIGCVVYDTSSKKIVARADYLISELWHDKAIFNTVYYYIKKAEYKALLKNGLISLVSVKSCMQSISDLMNEFKIDSIYCFNARCDKKALMLTCNQYGIFNPFSEKNFYDIMAYIGIIAESEKYKKFCNDNNYISKRNNLMINCETITKYLKNDVNFKEQHTAIADCEISIEMMQECISQGLKWDTIYPNRKIFSRY